MKIAKVCGPSCLEVVSALILTNFQRALKLEFFGVDFLRGFLWGWHWSTSWSSLKFQSFKLLNFKLNLSKKARNVWAFNKPVPKVFQWKLFTGFCEFHRLSPISTEFANRFDTLPVRVVEETKLSNAIFRPNLERLIFSWFPYWILINFFALLDSSRFLLEIRYGAPLCAWWMFQPNYQCSCNQQVTMCQV